MRAQAFIGPFLAAREAPPKQEARSCSARGNGDLALPEPVRSAMLTAKSPVFGECWIGGPVAGLVPTTHVFHIARLQDVDARVKPAQRSFRRAGGANGRLPDLRGRRCRPAVGADLPQRAPRLQDPWHAERRQVERHRLSDLVRRAAPRSRMADRRRARRSTRRKYFIVIINKFGNGLSSSPSNTPPPFDRAPLPAFHDDRQCAGAAAPARRGVRGRAGEARLRLLDGRHSRRFIGRRCSRTGSSASRRSAGRPRPRRTISCFSKGSRRR